MTRITWFTSKLLITGLGRYNWLFIIIFVWVLPGPHVNKDHECFPAFHKGKLFLKLLKKLFDIILGFGFVETKKLYHNIHLDSHDVSLYVYWINVTAIVSYY